MTRSIGSILKKARERKRLTLGDVHKEIKVHPKYIRALEKDNYDIFQGKVHSKGFLKLYSGFLGLDVNEILALWRREYESRFEVKSEERFFQEKVIEPPKFLVTPGLVAVVFMLAAILSFFGYLFYQYRSYTGAPKLDIYHPSNNLVVDRDILDITGRTDLDSELYVNNQQIILSPDGSFAESVKLKEGLNTLSIRAVNKLAKQTEHIRTVIYRPDKSPVIAGAAEEATESSKSENVDGEAEFIEDPDTEIEEQLP